MFMVVVDAVVHQGHGDVVMGVICTNDDEIFTKLKYLQNGKHIMKVAKWCSPRGPSSSLEVPFQRAEGSLGSLSKDPRGSFRKS